MILKSAVGGCIIRVAVDSGCHSDSLDGLAFNPVPPSPAGEGIRRVNEAQARVKRRIQYPERGRLVQRPAEYISTEADRRNIWPRISQLADRKSTRLNSSHLGISY